MFDKLQQKFDRLQFNTKQQQAFVEDLHALVQDGVPVNRAVETMQEIGTGVQEKVAESIAESIARGQLLAEGMTGWFSQAVVEVIRAGETSGTLTETLESASRSLAEQSGAIGSVITSLIYPLMVIIGALGMAVFIKHSVFESFIAIKPLSVWPSIGRNMYDLASFAENWWWLVLILLVALVMAVSRMLRNFTGPWRLKLDNLPLLSLYRESNAARIMETFGLLLQNGVAFNRCLMILQNNANPYLAWHLLRMELRLSGGLENIADVMDTGMLSQPDLLRLRVVAKGKGFEHALVSLGKKANIKVAKQMTRAGKITGGVLLAGGAIIAASMVFAIYTVGSIMAT